MIRRPKARYIEGNRAVELANEIAGETAPARAYLGNIARLMFWTHAVPLMLLPVMAVLYMSWPEIFASAWGHYAMIGVWGITAWKFWLAPQYAQQARRRMQDMETFGDAEAMRRELEANWSEAGRE